MSTRKKKEQLPQKDAMEIKPSTKKNLERRQKYAYALTAKYRMQLANTVFVAETNPQDLRYVDLTLKKMYNVQAQIGAIPLSVLCGTVMGDGGLYRHAAFDPDTNQWVNKSYQQIKCKYPATTKVGFLFKHSTRQAEWFYWKSLGALGAFCPIDTSFAFLRPEGYQREAYVEPYEIYGKLLVQSIAYAQLIDIFDILYAKGRKCFERKWLNHMNNYFLMTLWLDDGSLMNKTQGTLCLNSTPLKELYVLRDYLQTVWGIKMHPTKVPSKATATNPDPHQLDFDRQVDLLNFLRIIAPIIPVKTMLYKVCFFHHDLDCRQRWTASLKAMVRLEWHEYIDYYYLGLNAILDPD